jgi:hypothetical protein
MLKQIRAELLKLRKSFVFLVLCLVMIGFGAFLSMASGRMGLEAYETALMGGELSVIVVSVFSALFICAEFDNRTIGTSVCCGNSRWRVLLSKIIVLCVGVVILMTAFPATMTIIAAIKNGFSSDSLQLQAFTPAPSDIAIYLVRTFALYLLSRLGLAAFCAMLAYMIRNVVGAIGVGAALSIVLLVLAMRGPQDIMKFTFMWQMGHLLSFNSLQDVLFSALVSVTNMALMLFAAHFIFKKADLK